MALDNAGTSVPQRPLRILAYADSTQTFGAESVFCDVVRALSRVPGFHVTAAASSQNTILWEAMNEVSDVEVIDVPAHSARWVPLGVWDPRRGQSIRRKLPLAAWDVMVVNMPSIEYGAAPLLWAQRAAAASIGILHLHHSIRATSSERPAGGIRDRLAAILLRRLDHALVISPAAPQVVAGEWGLPIESCSVLPLLARRPASLERDAARHQLGLPPEVSLVGMLGRIDVGQKGHDVFVEAAAKVARDNPEVGFVIAGEGPDEPLVRSLVAERGLVDRFFFLGTVRPPDAVLGALDAIAFPSRFEGLPLSAIEALSVGLPGIASRVDGLAVVWPEQWTTEPDDPDALARGIRDLLAADAGVLRAVLEKASQNAEQWLTHDVGAHLESVVRGVLLGAKERVQRSRAVAQS